VDRVCKRIQAPRGFKVNILVLLVVSC